MPSVTTNCTLLLSLHWNRITARKAVLRKHAHYRRSTAATVSPSWVRLTFKLQDITLNELDDSKIDQHFAAVTDSAW